MLKYLLSDIVLKSMLEIINGGAPKGYKRKSETEK